MQLVDVVKLSEELCQQPIQANLKYATSKNFVGRPIDGYESGVTDLALLTPIAARQLCCVQNDLLQQYGYGLLIYDAYRPVRAVQDFLLWSRQSAANAEELARKAKHYPTIQKSQLFALGYLMEDSGHCYGNTVDLVLIDARTGQPLEMGTRFDYMDKRSHVAAEIADIGAAAWQHRQILSTAMLKFGFQAYPEEYWHFSHGGMAGREVDHPMDIAITKAMKGI